MSIGIRPVFEQWALEQGFDIGRADDNSYRTQTTDAAWGGWVAANAPAAQPAQDSTTGCACRWDADNNRVATCERHQGWLDVVSEWADRAKAAEAALQSAQPVAAQPLTPQQRVDICDACASLDYDDNFLGDVGKIIDLVEAAHGIGAGNTI